MTPLLRPIAAGLALAGAALAAPAHADVFSSQSFTGDTATTDNLPGVNLDVVPGLSNGFSNCAEDAVPSFATPGLPPQKSTTCRFGNFSITSTNSGAASQLYDTTYGGNPPPWVPNWRP